MKFEGGLVTMNDQGFTHLTATTVMKYYANRGEACGVEELVAPDVLLENKP